MPLGEAADSAAGLDHGRVAGRFPLPFPREPGADVDVDDGAGRFDLDDNAAFAAIFEFSWAIGVVAWPSCRDGVATVAALPGRLSGCEKNCRCRSPWVH